MMKVINWFDDFINPIVVKEVRQSVNGKSLVSTALLLLAAQLTYLTFFVLDNPRHVIGRGDKLFITILAILFLACLLGVALMACFRTTHELSGSTMDLMHTTVIKPRRIIGGKFSSALVMVIYLFSLCIPFLFVAYFLRGISIPNVAFGIFIVFIAMIPIITFSILVASLPFSNVIKIFIFIGAGYFIYRYFLGYIYHSRYHHYSYELLVRTVIFNTLAWLIAAAGFYVLAIACVSHKASNRLLPFRVFILSSIIVTYAAGFGFNAYNHFVSSSRYYRSSFWSSYGQTSFFFAIYAIILIIMCFLSSVERLEPGPRILNEMRRRKWMRIPYFLFSTGTVNNNIFCLLLMGAIAAYTGYFTYNSRYFENFIAMSGACVYALAYAGIVNGLRFRLQKVFPKVNGIVYLLITGLIFNFIPLVITLFLYMDFDKVDKHGAYFFILSPGGLYFEKTRYIAFFVAVSIFAITLVVNIRYYVNYIKLCFSRPEESAEGIIDAG